MSKITVLLSEAEFLRFDKYCEERGFKKSTLIARLIREYLDSTHFPKQSPIELEDKFSLDELSELARTTVTKCFSPLGSQLKSGELPPALGKIQTAPKIKSKTAP